MVALMFAGNSQRLISVIPGIKIIDDNIASKNKSEREREKEK